MMNHDSVALSGAIDRQARPDRSGSELLERAEFTLDRAEYSRAATQARAAIHAFEAVGDRSGVYDAREVLARSWERLGRTGQALELQQSNLQLGRELGDWERSRRALQSLGTLFSQQGDHLRALESFSESLVLAEEHNVAGAQATAHGSLGSTYERMADLAPAMKHHQLSSEQFAQAGLREQQAQALSNLGNVHAELHDFAAALRQQQRSLELRRETGDRPGEAAALQQLGFCHYELRQLAAAERMLHESFVLASTLNEQLTAGRALHGRGLVAQEQGKLFEARKLFEKALELFVDADAAGAAAQAWQQLGKLEQAAGRAAQAVKSLQNALSLAGSVNDRLLLARLHWQLAEVYEVQEDYSAAVHHLKIAYATERTLFHEASRYRLQSTRIRLETERASRDQELQRLRNIELAEAYNRLKELHTALQAANTRQQSLVMRLETQRQLLERQTKQDELTGLFNRRYFNSAFRQEHRRISRSGQPLSLALCDIDDFKLVNDRFSHETGDRTLQAIAGLLLRSSRSTDVIARYGGEEFILLLPDTDLAAARELCERLRRQVELHAWDELQRGLHVTISVGVAVSDGGRPSERELMRLADRRLYRAKILGKNRVVAED